MDNTPVYAYRLREMDYIVDDWIKIIIETRNEDIYYCFTEYIANNPDFGRDRAHLLSRYMILLFMPQFPHSSNHMGGMAGMGGMGGKGFREYTYSNGFGASLRILAAVCDPDMIP